MSGIPEGQGELFTPEFHLPPDALKAFRLRELITQQAEGFAPLLLEVELSGRLPSYRSSNSEIDFAIVMGERLRHWSRLDMESAGDRLAVGFMGDFYNHPHDQIQMVHLMPNIADDLWDVLVNIADIKKLSVYNDNAATARMMYQNDGDYIQDGIFQTLNSPAYWALEECVQSFWPGPQLIYDE